MSVEKGTAIDRDLVGEVVGRYRTENLFAFLDQLGNKDTATLVRRMHRIIEGGEEPVFVLAMLLRRTLQLLHVSSLLSEKGVSPREVTNRMAGRVSPYQLTLLMNQARSFDPEDLKIYLTNLRWADVKLKSTTLQSLSVLDTALVASIERKTLAL
jgi:DNA polymerase III delta subunit